MNEDFIAAAKELRSLLMVHATGGSADEEVYSRRRAELLKNPLTRDRVPRFVRTCRDLNDFWGYIQPLFAHYAERRAYLREQFDPLLTFLEDEGESPADGSMDAALRKVDWAHVQETWRRARDRREADPGGAITAARTMLETVCKHILDERKVAYDEGVLADRYDIVLA